MRGGYDLPDPVFVAELDLDALRRLAREEPRYRPVSRFPALTRDIAFVVAADVPAGRAEGLIKQSGGDDLESVSLFDAYEGRPVPEGHRSLAFSLTFRRADRTLADEEVAAAMERIRSSLTEALGARLRE